MQLPRLPIIMAVALTSWLAPSPAEACSCLAGLVYSLPAGGATQVPLNPYIRLGYSFDEPRSFALEDAAGNRVDVAPVFTRSGSVYEVGLELAPGVTLAPNTDYTVLAGGRADVTFSTGSAIDETAPGLEGIASFAGGYDDGCSDGMCSSCGDSLELGIAYAGATDDLTPSSDLLYRVYYAKGDVAPDSSSPSVILRDGWPLGYSFCLATYTDMAPGETVTIRASTIDVAGHESPLSDPISTVVGDDPDAGQGPGCGQSIVAMPGTPARGAGWLVVGLAAIPLMRRRRR